MICPKCKKAMTLLNVKYLGNTQYLSWKCHDCGDTQETRV